MRSITFLLLFLIPFVLPAQLDRMRTDMTEQEFVRTFPEARRDYVREAVWTNEAAAINGVKGNALWYIYRDTTTEYRFNSVKEQGPSARYPDADSTAVYAMKQSAMTLVEELTLHFGKPVRLISVGFSGVGKSGQTGDHFSYKAEWDFGVNDFITVEVTTEMSTGNMINAPGKFTVVESQAYELAVRITHREAYTQDQFGVGQPESVFFRKHPECAMQVRVKRDQVYVISDSVTALNAEWIFHFSGGMLLSFDYEAYLGTEYRAKSDAAAYEAGKKKTELLYAQGSKSLGKAASVNNNLKPSYVPPDKNIQYTKPYFAATWGTPSGIVTVRYTENGGGKNPASVFHLEVHFMYTSTDGN